MPGIERYARFLGSRYRTFLAAFEAFAATGGRTIVELGTSRSFVSDAFDGCMNPDPKYWRPDAPERWDWGAGIFTRMCATHLADRRPDIHSVDISHHALGISKVITAEYADLITYHHMASEDFLSSFDGTIDLLYMDAGETGWGAEALHLREARIVVERELMAKDGVILIDDVDVPGEEGSKGARSIPFLCENGFEAAISDYQVLLRRIGSSAVGG